MEHFISPVLGNFGTHVVPIITFLFLLPLYAVGTIYPYEEVQIRSVIKDLTNGTPAVQKETACRLTVSVLKTDVDALLQDVVRALFFSTKNPDARECSFQAIAFLYERNPPKDKNFGQDSITPRLVNSLNDFSPEIRLYSAKILGLIGRPAKRAAAKLVNTLEDPDPGVRSAAAASLGSIKATDPSVLTALVQALRNGNEGAATGLAKLGRRAKRAVPELITLVETYRNDEASPAASGALRALVAIAPKSRRVKELVDKALSSRNTKLRQAANDALYQMENRR